MLRRLIGEDVELVLAAAPGLWPVKADPDQMVQVLMNLCVNARDAMPDGGRISIATRNLKCSAAEECPGLQPGEYVELTVTDTGVGMTQEVLEHIFDPFFTTKPPGKGTGLGLSTVFGIVTQNGGNVWAESEPDKGARIIACFPRAEKAAAKAEPATIRALPRGTETVLVVEDEQALRDSIGEALRGIGYTVLSAGAGEEALQMAAGHQGEIVALITDVVMPRMNGWVLSAKLKALRPAIQTIFMSGYTDDSVVRNEISKSRMAFLQKPFSMASLARKLREVIDSA
jgi:CheY-like chemotaxis protein